MPRLCKYCDYHEEIDEDHYCYRYPPRLVSIKGRLQTEYPIVDPKIDWCGEFEPKQTRTIIDAEIVEG